MNPPNTPKPLGNATAFARLALLISMLCAVAGAAQPGRRSFDLPAGDAVVSLRLFADQSGQEIVYPPDLVRGTRTNPVKGEYMPKEAIDRMLAGTTLVASQTTGGLLSIKRADPPNAERAAPVPTSVRPNQTPSPAAGTDDDPIEMSPFEVSATSDEGYAARETLAGTRFRSELKDVPSQISVMTAEFLDDIATVSIEDAFRYSINVENQSEFQSAANGEFAGGVVNILEGNRVRGLRQPGKTHDFFQTFVPGHTYNTERITFSSGPNSILFGAGNPSGTVDTSFKRANLRRPRYSLTLRGDNHGSLQTSVDLNYPIVKDRLALRVAGVKVNDKNWRKPAGEDADRLYGNITIRPFPTTTIRGWYENIDLERVSARNTRASDQVTPWIEAGRPLFDNSFASPMPNPAASNPIFSRNTLAANVLLIGATATDVLMPWGSSGSSVAASQPVYSVLTKGPGQAPHQTGADSYAYSLTDPSISPNNISINGEGVRNLIDADIKGVLVEQRIGQKFFIEFGHNEEKVIAHTLEMVRGGDMRIYADANMYLPDRVTPNPNVGRYYVEGIGRGRNTRRSNRETRATASYDLDLTEKNKWLGSHRLAAMFQRVRATTGGQEFISRHVPAGLSFEETLELYGNSNRVPGNPTFNTLNYRAYLSDPADPSTGRTYYFEMPFPAFAPHTFPDGSTVYTTHNPFGGTNAGSVNRSLLDGTVLAMQSRFWGDRIVTTLGWRADRASSAGHALPRLGGPTSAFQHVHTAPLPDNWESVSGETTTAGAVFHALPWFSVFYNQASTWNAPRLSSHNPDGTTVPGSTGDGHDYGLMLRFLDNRVSFRLNKYKNTTGPDNSAFRTSILAPVIAIERTLVEAADHGIIPAYQAPPGYNPDPPGTFYYELTSDQVSTGYEAELVANPTRNWRVSINASKAKSTESNIGKVWVDFIQTRIPYWAENATLQGPEPSTNTITSRVLGIMQTLNLMRQSDGRSTEQGRSWRANLVTRYTFSEGRMKGLFVGSGYRWRSKSVIGYRAMSVPNEFPFPGVASEIVVPALDAPVFGKSFNDLEGFLGYSRPLTRRINWRVQLNVRNLLDDDTPIPQRANTAGDVTIITIPQPRTFIFSTTFTF